MLKKIYLFINQMSVAAQLSGSLDHPWDAFSRAQLVQILFGLPVLRRVFRRFWFLVNYRNNPFEGSIENNIKRCEM